MKTPSFRVIDFGRAQFWKFFLRDITGNDVNLEFHDETNPWHDIVKEERANARDGIYGAYETVQVGFEEWPGSDRGIREKWEYQRPLAHGRWALPGLAWFDGIPLIPLGRWVSGEWVS
jgi:hypothetical protein